MKYTAVVLAGSRPGRDEFAASHEAEFKALIAVAGEPMVRRPVRALLASDQIGSVIVLAQAPNAIKRVLPDDPRLGVRKSGETIASTLSAMFEDSDIEWPLLVTTADHALLDPAMEVDVFRVLHGEQELEFREVLRPGDVLLTTGMLESHAVRGNNELFVIRTDSVNQHGRLAVRGRFTAFVRG